MPFVILPASAFDIIKNVLSVVGAVFALITTVYGIWIAVRNRRETQQQRTHREGLELSGKFARIESDIQQLHTAAKATEKQHTEFHHHVNASLQQLAQQADELKHGCVQHQSAYDVTELKQKVNRLVDRFEQLNRDLGQYKELVSARYLSLASYQSDLALWTSNFDSFRSSLRDLTLLISKLGDR